MNSLLNVALETHQVIAFLAVLCAVVFSWSPTGRRVVNAVVALQVLLGLAIAGIMGAQHLAQPPALVWHLLIGLAVMACYGLAMRFGKQAGGATRALAFSIAAVALVLLNVYLGLRMAGLLSA